MRKNLLPALGIVIVSIILIGLNQLTDTTIIRDYAFLFIIAGMLLGVILTRLANRDKD